jgi:Domain of unknown function (DUF4157)
MLRHSAVPDFEQHRDRAREQRKRDRTQPDVEPEAAALRVAASVGNRAFGRLVARAGDGILPDGRAHPDVEATIARTRGSGGALDTRSRDRVGAALGDPLDDVRVHTDATADRLARAVSARAFTTGSDIYFASGEYQPGTSGGDRLLAHELTHVVQQRGAPTSGPLTVTQPGDAHEREAEAASGDIAP